MLISIVIPTLNEAEQLNAIIAHTRRQAFAPAELEIMVVDAGSTDGTLSTINDNHIRQFCKPEYALKKYKSLNYGIEQATSDILLFLDADTLLPKHFDLSIKEALTHTNVVGGAFEFSFQKPVLPFEKLCVMKFFFLQNKSLQMLQWNPNWSLKMM